jgi:hypothetical protein
MSANGTSWQISGDEVVSCNCDWGCPCQFNANPTQGFCEAAIVFQINDGNYGDTSMDGVRFGLVVHWDGAIHEGGGHLQLVVGEEAGDEQREALLALATGEHGGTYFEIFSAVCPHRRDPVTAKIDIDVDRDRREGTFRIGDLAESRIEPIKSPVDGSEHRARINLPGGFEYEEAEMGNTVEASANGDGPLSFTLENTYAQLNPFEWSNA